MALYYEDLKSMSHLQVTLHHPESGFTLVGLIGEDISFSGSVEYGTPYSGLGDAANVVAGGAQQLAGGFGSGGGQLRLGSLSQTVKMWNNSAITQYPATFTLVNYKPGMDVMKDAWRLLSLTKPKGAGGFALEAPGGYSGSESSANGVWSLKYGEWFEGHNLVLLDVSIGASATQTQDEGEAPRPAFVTVTATFEPYRHITEAEFLAHYAG